METKRTLKQIIRQRGVCNSIIIILNILVFLYLEIIGNTNDAVFMANHGAMFTPYVLEGAWWQLFTCMFLHFGFAHIFGNLLLLFFIGDNLERAVGHVKFLVIYLGGGLLGNLFSMYMDIRTDNFAVAAGASGAIFAVIGALLYIVIRNKGRLEDMTTGRIILMVAYALYQGFTTSGVDNYAHIGGLIGGFLLAVLLYRKKTI